MLPYLNNVLIQSYAYLLDKQSYFTSSAQHPIKIKLQGKIWVRFS